MCIHAEINIFSKTSAFAIPVCVDRNQVSNNFCDNSSFLDPSDVVHGSESEYHRRTKSSSCTRIRPTHDRSRVVASGIQTLEWCAVVFENSSRLICH